jgi:hypothetical protein
MIIHKDTGVRCAVAHQDGYGECIVCECNAYVRPHEWREHISAAVEALATKRDAEAAVIETAKAVVDVIAPPKDTSYREYQAAAGELCVRVSVLRALEGDA